MILSDPDDMTVFLDDDAFFSCLTQSSSSSYWRLNGTDYNELSSDVQDDLIVSSASSAQSELLDLTITARAEYNETRVQCVIESNDGDSIVSDTAILYIQGMYDLYNTSKILLHGRLFKIQLSFVNI